MVNHKSVAVAFAVLILAVLTAATGYALGGPRENYLTFSRSVALPGVKGTIKRTGCAGKVGPVCACAALKKQASKAPMMILFTAKPCC